MAVLYFLLLCLFLLAVLLTKKYKKNRFLSLDKKEHPLRILYPASAWLLDLKNKKIKTRPDENVKRFLKLLNVRENIENEFYIYNVKKISVCIAAFAAFICLGFFASLANGGTSYVKSVERNDYGGAEKEYELVVDTGDGEETIAVDVEAVRYTEEEIYDLFDKYYSGIVEELLNENESAENVTGPLDFISEYNGIKIFWDVEDTKIVDYNGNIKKEPEEGEEILINLTATLSMDECTESFIVPVVIRKKEPDEREQLIEDIYRSISENNSIYERNVNLPEEVDGKSILFKSIKEDNSILFLLLGMLALGLIAFFYDSNLKKEVEKRNDELMMDFSEIVSKLSLLYEAGLSIKGSWEKIAEDAEKHEKGNHYAYREMRLTLEKIKSGMSERECYSDFGRRCGVIAYIKLGNTLEQNLSKGTRGMSELLRREAVESFSVRKRLARKKGEEASTKMLVPMVMMLVVVIAIIAIPALMSININ